MLFHNALLAARTAIDGSLVLLDDRDRGPWDREAIAKGNELLESAAVQARSGPYLLQAAIAYPHVNAPGAAETERDQIATPSHTSPTGASAPSSGAASRPSISNEAGPARVQGYGFASVARRWSATSST